MWRYANIRKMKNGVTHTVSMTVSLAVVIVSVNLTAIS